MPDTDDYDDDDRRSGFRDAEFDDPDDLEDEDDEDHDGDEDED